MEGTVARRALRVSFYLPCTRQSFHASGYLVLCGHWYHSVGNISLPEPGPWTNAPLELTIYYRICIVNKSTPLEHAGLPSIMCYPLTHILKKTIYVVLNLVYTSTWSTSTRVYIGSYASVCVHTH